jgi:broad specificity phosphatase PhoE
MSIYFVRHGQTDWNLNHKIQGNRDIKLNSEGRRQATAMRENLKDIHFDAIFSSPLSRAKETAKIIAKAHSGTPLIFTDQLAERNFGDYEGRNNNGDFYGLWHYDNANTRNGETPKNLEKRISRFLDRVIKEYTGKNVLLVSHGGVGLLVAAYFYGVPEDGNLLNYVSGNGELKIYAQNRTS